MDKIKKILVFICAAIIIALHKTGKKISDTEISIFTFEQLFVKYFVNRQKLTEITFLI